MHETQTPRREVIDNRDGTVTEYSNFEPTEGAMQRLADLLFKEHWGEITVGPCIQGAIFEIRFKDPPKVSLSDGYLTVDLGHWHFHLCVGTHQGTPSPELAAKRRVARAAFFETRGRNAAGAGAGACASGTASASRWRPCSCRARSCRRSSRC